MLTCHKYITALVVAMGVSVPSIVFAATSLPLIQYNCPPTEDLVVNSETGSITGQLQAQGGAGATLIGGCQGVNGACSFSSASGWFTSLSYNLSAGCTPESPCISCSYTDKHGNDVWISSSGNVTAQFQKNITTCYSDPQGNNQVDQYDFHPSSLQVANAPLYCLPAAAANNSNTNSTINTIDNAAKSDSVW